MIRPQELAATKNILAAFQNYGRRAGYSVEVEGKEHLKPALNTGKTIHVYAATHRHGIHDTILMGEVAPKDSLIFMAPQNFLPSFMVSGVDRNPGVIAVGKKGAEKPVEKALAQLKAGYSRNIFIFPEGGLPAGLNENAPVREKFSTELIARLRSEGYEVKVIPITYEGSARFMNELPADGLGQILKAKAHAPIDDATLAAWEKQDPQFLNRYLRQLYLENLETNADQLAGLIRPHALKNYLEKFLGKNCSALFWPL